MKGKILVSVLPVLLVIASQQTWAAQSCNADITATAPNIRYVDNGDGTVTDTQTGLMWKQCSEGLGTTSTACDTGVIATYTWQNSLGQAQAINTSGGFAGHTDWRVPNVKELATLVERKCYQPAINSTLFPRLASSPSQYWTSSTVQANGLFAWYVDFDHGVAIYNNKTGIKYVRLVRDTF